MRSLRARLLLTVGAVVVLALGAVAILSSRATRHAFLRLEDVRATRNFDSGSLRQKLEARYRQSESWEGVESFLSRLARERQEELVLIGAGDRPIAVSAGLAASRIALDPGGGMRIERQGAEGTSVLVVHVPAVEVRDGAGQVVGRVFPVTAPGSSRLKDQREFLGSVDRWIFGGVAVLGALALLATALFARRILKPVEELTAAARRMERGDLAARVEVRSTDEIGELGGAFNSMAEARAKVEELRRRLIGDVAHELRTPLTNLKAQLEAIEDGLLPPGGETLASLREETAILERLVDDLQDLALAEAGQLKLEITEVSLGETARAAVSALKSTAEAAGVRVECEAEPDLPLARADRERVGQILRNLLANAVTHSPRGGSVRVTARREGAGLAVAVRDGGPGIAPEHQARIFDRFYRVDPSRSRDTGGAGLGLAIVRQLARAQGGDARVESEPGRGATFSLTLPASGQR